MTRGIAWSGCLLLVLGVIGCYGDPTLGQYKTYDELLSRNGDDADSDTTSASSAASDDDAIAAELTAEDEDWSLPVSALVPVNVVDGSEAVSILQAAGTAPSAVPGESTAPGGPRTIELLVPEREFKPEGKPAGLRVSYDDLDLLKVLNMEPVPDNAPEHFPDWLKSLDGQQIRIRGFMYPTFESTGIERFVLARDNQICCFGRDPKVYDLIAVELKPGKTTDYIPNRPFDVVGRFRIEMLAEGGKPLGLYWLEDAQVSDR
jgi:hypothetical protein